MEHEAYIDRATGRIYWVSETIEGEVPEDLEADRYIPIPHKNDLDLGMSLALQFAADALPNQYRTIEAFFRSRGAYPRFKDLLAAEGRLEDWYAFEATTKMRTVSRSSIPAIGLTSEWSRHGPMNPEAARLIAHVSPI